MFTVAVKWIEGHKLTALASVIFFALCYLLVTKFVFQQHTRVLRLSAGPTATRRHKVAEYLAQQAAHHALSIQLVDSPGSEDCLEQIAAGKLDAAIVSSGVKIPHDDNIRVLAATQLEAVHLLVRNDLAEADELIPALRGRRVNLGVPGGTEWLLAQEFLKFARLQLPSAVQPGDVIPTDFCKEELIERAQAILRTTDEQERAALRAELPDCLIVVATMPSTVAQILVEAADFRIVPLPATRAFLLDNLQATDAATTVIEREFLEPTTIPANSYFAQHGFPQTDCETIGVRLLVVAHRDTPASAVRPLMATLFEGEFSRRMTPKSPRDLPTPYAIHPAAMAYLDRDKPLITYDVVESLSTLFSIFGAFSAGALSLYGLLWRKRRRKPIDYYAEVHKLELFAVESLAPGATRLSRDVSQYLDERLTQLRQELIRDVCQGRIEGEQVIGNILGLLADSRQNLLRASEQISPQQRLAIPLRRAA